MRARSLATLVTTLLATVVPATASLAASVEPASTSTSVVGHDVSYPQCTSPGATTTTVGSLGGAFGIVGVTGGRPFGPNSCAAAEYAWASSLPGAPALYVNTANPAPTSSYYWPASGASDPALCRDAASTTDPGCAYDYGWHAAADALTRQAASIPNAAGLTWWLDVETGNSWHGDGVSNAADLQGAVDYLRSHGVPSVGVYSTSSQWNTITGGYNATTAGSYASSWAPEFTAQYPMTGAPVWVAGLGTASSASTACGTSFTGGPTLLAQYVDGSGYDADLSCSTTTVTAPTAPSQLTASGKESAVALSWSPPSSTGGAPVTYAVYRGAGPGAESTAPVASGLTAAAFTDTGLTNGSAYYYVVRAVNSAGTSGASNETTATPQAVPQSFTLSLSPASGSVRRGHALTTTVGITQTGSPQAVTLSATSLPSRVAASFQPASLTGSGSSTLRLSVATDAARGTYAVTVTATGASGTRSATYSLTVR